MLAGEDTHSAGALGERPAEDVELCFGLAAIRQIDRSAEVRRSERLETTGLEVSGTRRRIVGGKGGALDALALRKKVARRLVLVGVVQHAEQFEIVFAEH